jgi:exonuclease III
MIILSLNAHGVRGAPKIQALKRLVADSKTDILLIQETMCSKGKVVDSFRPWLRDWSFGTSDSVGFSGGLLSAWGPNFNHVSLMITLSSISLGVDECALSSSFRIVNIYGPYADKRPFWEGLSNSGILRASNVIIGGDINFTLSLKEFWGKHPRRYMLEVLFSYCISFYQRVDLEPPKLSQTWRNG